MLLAGNGPPYTSEVVRTYLEAHRVIHIRNLPCTSEHNAVNERGHRELKDLCELDRGVRIDGLDGAVAALHDALMRLNARLRTELGYTSQGRHSTRPGSSREYSSRQGGPYAVARRIRDEARQGEGTDRARRLAERRAALALLEQHRIITITRGSDDQGGVKSEGVSCSRGSRQAARESTWCRPPSTGVAGT